MHTQAAPRAHEAGVPRKISRNVLLVSGSGKGHEAFAGLLRGGVYHISGVASSGGEARRILLSASVDALIVNTPLPDEFGHELAVHGAEMGLGVLVAVKSQLLPEVRARVSGAGVLSIGKPLSRELFAEALSLMDSSQNRQRQLEEENRKLRGKLEELRIISKAKCLLVQFRHLTEEEAHKAIEKQAMDSRITRRTVAQEIIETLG